MYILAPVRPKNKRKENSGGGKGGGRESRGRNEGWGWDGMGGMDLVREREGWMGVRHGVEISQYKTL